MRCKFKTSISQYALALALSGLSLSLAGCGGGGGGSDAPAAVAPTGSALDVSDVEAAKGGNDNSRKGNRNKDEVLPPAEEESPPIAEEPAPQEPINDEAINDEGINEEPAPVLPAPETINDVIPEERRIAWSAGVINGIPDYPIRTSVTNFGAIPNDGRDDSAAFQAAIDSLASAGAVHVPTGAFDLHTRLNMRSGVVLRGDGPQASRLLINHADHAIAFTEFNSGSNRPVISGADLKSSTLTVESTAGFTVGGYGVILQSNDPAKLYTQERWNVSWGQDALGQVFRVASMSGNQITLESPLNIQFDPRFEPRVRPLTRVIENAGLEDLSLDRVDSSDKWIVRIRQGANLWFRNIGSHRASKAHIHVRESHRIEVRDSYFYDASNHGGGGHGYGVMLSRHSSNTLVENNIFRRLRHGLILQLGASGNVMSYNYVREAKSEATYYPTDLSLHGHYPTANLFEGNVLDQIGIGDHWGPAGPWNSYHRNWVGHQGIFLQDFSNWQNITANVLETRNGKELRWDETIDADSQIMHQNLQNGLLLLSDQVSSEASFADSYYHASKPAFYGNLAWPSIGPDAATQTNPAEQRFVSGSFPLYP